MQVITNSRLTRVLVVVLLLLLGRGLDQLPHAEPDYCARRWLAQEVNGPLIRCYSTMACMQVKFRASRAGTASLDTSRLRMRVQLDVQRIASLGTRWLRAQTRPCAHVGWILRYMHRLAALVAASSLVVDRPSTIDPISCRRGWELSASSAVVLV